MFGVFRHERDGVVDEETRHRMRLVIPHVRRAVLISRVIDLKSAEAASFADTLDGVRAAMFLVDDGGRIVHANSAGYALLAAGDPLSAMSGQPWQENHKPTKHCTTGCRWLAKATRQSAKRASRLRYWRATESVSSLTCCRSGPARAGVPARAMRRRRPFFCKSALYAASPPELIAQTYKLTPTELRVMLAVIKVGGVPEVATALGVAESTVKTHLTRLYEKTGARRHADLVKLMAGFLSPLNN